MNRKRAKTRFPIPDCDKLVMAKGGLANHNQRALFEFSTKPVENFLRNLGGSKLRQMFVTDTVDVHVQVLDGRPTKAIVHFLTCHQPVILFIRAGHDRANIDYPVSGDDFTPSIIWK